MKTTTGPLRVVVADDSPTVRELLVAIVNGSPELRVAAEAADGEEAVRQVRALRPDVVLMDIRMPRLDGYEATRVIMRDAPTPIVLITGNVDAREADASVRALSLGALWVLRKPPGPGRPGFDAAARQIVEILKAMAGVRVRALPEPSRAQASRRPEQGSRAGWGEPRRSGPVAIAASTGGPAALGHVLDGLPAAFPSPILVVQHISPGFVASFATTLGRTSRLRVKVAEAGEPLAAATVYVAPDGRHLGVSPKGVVHLSDDAAIDGFRPSATHLFRSVAEVYGACSVAVILTGMGQDGVAGLGTVREAGGLVLAQDEATSVVYGMPGVAAREGLVDRVLPLPSIPLVLKEVLDGGDPWRSPA